VVEGRRPIAVEEIVPQDDGLHTYISLKFPLTDASGHSYAVCGISTDITDRKCSEDALRLSEERTRAALRAALDAIVVMDHEGTIVEFNPAAERMFKHPRESVLGLPLADVIVPPALRGQHRRGLARYLATGEGIVLDKRLEMTGLRADGSEIPVEVSITRLPGTSMPMFTGFLRDLTEQKRADREQRNLEEQLRHAQKMDAIGRLAGGVAHDFNNLLTVIRGYGDMLLDDPGLPAELREAAEEICKAGAHATDMTRQLLAVSRRQLGQPRNVSVGQTVRGLEKMLQRPLGEEIDLHLLLANVELLVRTDPGHLEQIILNLVINARDAMPTGGRLTIETSEMLVTEAYAAAHLGLTQGRLRHRPAISRSDLRLQRGGPGGDV
jgi:PAS domain S-box-containing protein